MADESTIYRQTLHQIYETCSPDELVQGWITQDMIVLASSGTHKRGELLMTGSGGFVPAASEGIAGAKEICILCSDRDIPEGMTSTVYGYFSGTFKADSVIFPWESEGDSHEEQVELVREALRERKIFLK